jgi:hypothetical protein
MEHLLESFIVLEEEVHLFEAYEHGYFALLQRGPRIDILRIFNFQPEICDFNDYPTYMFIESMQGFFIMRQDVREGRPGPWIVCAELHPRNPIAFFAAAHENRDLLLHFLKQIAPQPPCPAPPPEKSD